MSFDAKSGILKAINETNDPAMRTVLMLLLGVFEEIVEKMDAFVNNEAEIRNMVLNGHTDVHHKHHEWIEERLRRDDEVQELISWMSHKRAEEIKAAERAEDTKHKVGQALIVEAVKYLVFGGGCAAIAVFIVTRVGG